MYFNLVAAPWAPLPKASKVLPCLAPVHNGVVSFDVDSLHVPDKESAK